MLIEKGTNGMYQIKGIVNGVNYVVGLNKGRVGQFHKNRWCIFCLYVSHI